MDSEETILAWPNSCSFLRLVMKVTSELSDMQIAMPSPVDSDWLCCNVQPYTTAAAYFARAILRGY